VAPLAVLVSVRTSEEHRHPDREPAKGQQLSVRRPVRSPQHTPTRQRGLWFFSDFLINWIIFCLFDEYFFYLLIYYSMNLAVLLLTFKKLVKEDPGCYAYPMTASTEATASRTHW
jgi:hypothetical protein